MTIIKKSFRRKINRTKSLGFLLIAVIILMTFNSTLFTVFNRISKKSDNEVFSERETPQASSNNPTNAGDFEYYKIITIDHAKVSGTEDLIDFPLLISIFDSDLHNNTQSDGSDIAFSNNFQWLDHEIELFNQLYNATHTHLVAWVRIPVLSPTDDTKIRMYYGNPFMETRENPTRVWNDGYAAVWHLNETGTGVFGEFKDSTSNDNDGRGGGGFPSYVPSRISGKIGYAQEFDGSDDYINCGGRPSVQITGTAVTIEAWVQLQEDLAPEWGTGIASKGDSYALFQDWDGNRKFSFTVRTSSQTWVSDSNKQLATWYHVVGVYDGTTATIFVDGNAVFNQPASGPIAATSDSVWIGQYDQAFDGYIDEVRISDIVRSADWIKTEYTNQNDPDSFYSVGNTKKVYVPSIFDFKYFKEITFDHTKVSGTNNLFNFPVLISIFDADLHNETQLDGDDIAFNNGTSWLFHEIELFNKNYNSTHAKLVAWVCIPKFSPFEDTSIRMYYGNSTMESQENVHGVWDSNYIGVWHLSETSGPVFDSTFNGYDGIVTGASPTSSSMIDGGQEFVRAETDYIEMPDTGNRLQLIEFTVEVWMKTPDSTVPDDYYIATQSLYYDTEAWAINICDDTDHLNEGRFTMKISGAQQTVYSNSEITGNNWHHLVGVRDSSQLLIYTDGSLANSELDNTPGQIIQSSKNISIGSAITVDSEDFNGIIDEVRISKVARSNGWIATGYENQKDPGSFYSVSSAIETANDIPSDAYIFNFNKLITIDHAKVFGMGDHSNFPLLISIFDSDLHSDVQADGDDIAFAIGPNWLDHEIELFNKNYNGTHAELVAWVRIPELSTSLDTHIRMYYGNSTMSSRENSTGVWDGTYKGVWHLPESSGFTQDSTSYNENGLVTGTVIRPSMGQIGNAYNYGTDGTFNVGKPADGHLDFGIESFMVSMWINIDTSTGTWQIPLYKGASSTWDPGYCFGTPTTGDTISFHITDGTNNIGSPDANIIFDTWTYIVGIVDRTNDLIRIYKDGYEVDSGTDINTILSLTDAQNIEFQCAHPTYDFDGLLDEIRVLNKTRSNNWIRTEYYNQYDPYSFYSIGGEQSLRGIFNSNLQVNAIDLYGNPVPSANISIYNQTRLVRNNITDSIGKTLFNDIIQADYNFTVSITSDIGNHVEIVNITSEALSINQSFQTIDLICDVSSNFFEVVDVDGALVDSGWVIVGNSTHELQNCSIDSDGRTRFWWVNTMPFNYNYTVYYQDNDYNPTIIEVALGDITIPNASIQVQASLTTINFNIQTLITKEPVGGVKVLLTATNTGESIVNLTTDNEGIATLRWLNSSGINGNYSLQLEFFGALRNFNMTSITKMLVTEANFTVSFAEDFYLYIEVSLENYETELISLNPSEYISVQWGSLLKLRIIFNVSKAVGAEYLLGPTYSDIMSYKILKGADLILFGNLGTEKDYTGTHYSFINTEILESDVTYLIFISAEKSGYSIPQELLLQLSILENNLILNQSQNDDSIQSVYWSDSIDFSVKSYGEISESFTTGTSIFQSIDHSFRFSLPNINMNWNLTQITFNIYNISWNVNASDIYLSILDPFGIYRIFNASNHGGWDYNLGVWTGITLNINKESPTHDNNFEFIISGTFDNTIDVIADASFVRNSINIQYAKFNISNTINLLSESEGWVIKNITFIIQNCYNTLTWQKVNLSTLTNLNISTAGGFKYSLQSGDENGNGVLIIDDKPIYPLDNRYQFTIESNPNIIFDVVINVEFIQAFYQNKHLETLNHSYIQKNIISGGNCQINLAKEWNDKYAVLSINGINNKTKSFSPSEVAMNIIIESQTYSIIDTLPGQGIFSLNGFNKDSLYSATIETNQPVNFTLSFKISYLRTVTYTTLGTVMYVIQQSPDRFGVLDYYPSLGEYLLTLDTSLVDADHYTIIFEAFKENYKITTKDLDFIVMNRLTLINGDSKIYRELKFIYVKDTMNFTFLYTDALTGARITDLTTQSFMWEKYDVEGNVTANGEGTLIQEDEGYL
ncbi:MAG: LamG-like jellyroll fold domain-containing protein, partial [Promethearchaeota archaeon]